MTDKREQAYQDYLKGMKYPDIAEKYEVSVSTVKSWATRHWKVAAVAPTATADEELQPQPRKRGGANNVKHGAYKKVSWEVLEDDEEGELLAELDLEPPHTPEEIMRNRYKNLLLRERRLSKTIKAIKEKYGEPEKLLTSITKSVTDRKGHPLDSNEKMLMNVQDTPFYALKVYESELTRVQAQILKIAEKLIQLEKATDDKNKSEELVYEWIQGVMDSGGKH